MTKNTLMTFPCDFPVKIIGKNSPLFLQEIVTIIRMHYPLTQDSAIKSQMSEQGNYQSITAVIHALDQATLDALYQDLSRHPDIHMVL
jgi:putative lipoic acid-binding regulatory protein